KNGSRGAVVTKIQEKLKAEGLYSDKADGIYGANTTAAVKKYQAKNGLTADGIVGAATLAKMKITPPTATSNDTELLARMISAESRGEPYEGQVAVGAIILNRIKHPSFPNSMAGVIYQPGAFSAINDGQFNQPVAEISRRAASDALNGVNPIGGAIYYYNPKTATNKWIRSRPIIKTIGRHVFCT
ncbi:MAG: spore cortex-lytic enzyme, partial [Clostridia bacterium]